MKAWESAERGWLGTGDITAGTMSGRQKLATFARLSGCSRPMYGSCVRCAFQVFRKKLSAASIASCPTC